MVKERNYDFCKRLLEVHKQDRRNPSLTKNDDEFEFISPTLEYIRNYPYAEETTNIYPVLVAIRSGKINLGDYMGKSHMRILTRIQELQKKRLLEFQKQYLENKF